MLFNITLTVARNCISVFPKMTSMFSTFDLWYVLHLGCHLSSVSWDVVQMGATPWTKSTGHHFILWWAVPVFPLLTMLHKDFKTLYSFYSLRSKWEWSVNGHKRPCFVLQLWSTAASHKIKMTMLHFKLVPWQPMHQNPLDIVCKWTQLTCVLWRSFYLYSPKCSVTLLTVRKHSHAPCSIHNNRVYESVWIIENTLKHPFCHDSDNDSFESVYPMKLMCFFDVFIFIKTHFHCMV